MEINLSIGSSYISEKIVNYEDTAAHYGSGLVEVFATPAMIALMENAAMHAALKDLPEGFNTVGTAVNIVHSKATPKGMKVSAKATLIKIDGKRLVFEIVAHDEQGEIGRGTHERYIIDTAKFMQKLTASKN